MFQNHTTQEGLLYLTSTEIPVMHAFSTRLGGVSRGEFASMNFSTTHGDSRENVRENYTRWCALFGAGPDECAIGEQVHGNHVQVVGEADRHVCLADVPYEADGLVTGTKNLPLFTFSADCVPVLLYDREEKSIGAVHCGWKSSVKDILGVALGEMAKFGTKAENICAAIGPAIGRCCFETDRDVPDAVTAWLGAENTGGLWTLREDGKYLVDLRAANARRLMLLGVPEENIDVCEECTMCHPEKYWSARYTRRAGVHHGILASGIVLR